MNSIADKLLAYQFIRKLTLPFNQWPAYQLGLIDSNGNFLKKYNTLTANEKSALGYYDIMIINLKKMIAKIPGGGSRLGTIAATLVLLNNKPLKEDLGIAGSAGDINGSTNSTAGEIVVPPPPHPRDEKKKKKHIKEGYDISNLEQLFNHYLKIVEDGGAVGPAAGPAVNAASTMPTLTPGNGNPAVPPDNKYKRNNLQYTKKLKKVIGEDYPPGEKKEIDDGGPLYAKTNSKLEKGVFKKFKHLIKSQQVKEDTSLEYHDQLNPKIWDDGAILKPEVRSKLLQIASAWANFAKINPLDIKDIIFTGGNANYNYTSKSDIDLHLVINRNDFGHDHQCDCTSCNINRMFVDEYLQDKKVLWTLTHSEISIYGYPVELYAQDIQDVPHQGQGVYSVMYDRWIQLPEFLDLHFESDPLLANKVTYYMKMIDKIIADKSDEDTVEKVKEKIRGMRGAAIAKGGEFSFENLVFKELRNAGYLDKLSDYQKSMKDKALSLT